MEINTSVTPETVLYLYGFVLPAIGVLDGQIHTSADGSRSWRLLVNLNQPELIIDNLMVDSRDSKIIYASGHRHTAPGGFFRSTDGRQLIAVGVATTPTFRAGAPRQLFEGRFLLGASFWAETVNTVRPPVRVSRWSTP